jgi:formylmethanofuran dehydrogenase subunit E
MNGRDSMPTDKVFPADFQKCVEFHGHVCPGLSIGFRAAQAGMDWLRENRAEDEELVAVVENNACGADAIQVLTGCTFGKGNFFFQDHGKHVFILAGRKSGKAVRIALKTGAMELSERHRELMAKMRQGKASGEEKKVFQELHLQKSRELLEKSLDSLFKVEPVRYLLPPRAQIEPSQPCARCGEPTMGSKLSDRQGEKVCQDCLKS